MSKQKLKIVLCASVLIALQSTRAVAGDTSPMDVCMAIANHPVYTKTSLALTSTSQSDFHNLLCTSDFKSSTDAQNAGISATVPIYNIPVPFTANWNQNQVQTWKSQNCNSTTSSADSHTQLYETEVKVDPAAAKYAYLCVTKAGNNSAGTAAVSCHLTEAGNVDVFEAEWRRTDGEPDSTAPVVESFSAINSTCQGSDTAFAPNQSRLIEGGTSVMCSVGDVAPAFTINTNRGSCSQVGTAKLPNAQLTGQVILTAPLFLQAGDLEITSGTKLVTNGMPLTIVATNLKIDGPASIVSFESSAKGIGSSGRSAGNISITASNVAGGGLTILNDGEPGGQGQTGSKGSPGAPGVPGQSRQPHWQSSCGGGFLGSLCSLVPSGCTGGEDGTAGQSGQPGSSGNQGAPGGNAGTVSLDLPDSQTPPIQVLTDVDLTGAPENCGGTICGGQGGAGGKGGPGGDGGPGGQGAPGSHYCGGTNAGPQGGTGPTGPTGPQGANGLNAVVQ